MSKQIVRRSSAQVDLHQPDIDPEPVARMAVHKDNGDLMLSVAYTEESAQAMFQAGIRRQGQR